MNIHHTIRREVPSIPSQNSAAPADGGGAIVLLPLLPRRPLFHSTAPQSFAASDGKPGIPSLSAGRAKSGSVCNAEPLGGASGLHSMAKERRAVTNSASRVAPLPDEPVRSARVEESAAPNSLNEVIQ